jgi:hypothetical protein
MEQLSLELTKDRDPDVRPPDTYGTGFERDPVVLALADLWIGVWEFSTGMKVMARMIDPEEYSRFIHGS